MVRQHRPIGGGERAIIQDCHPANTRSGVERLHCYQIGQHRPDTNHGEGKHRISGGRDRRHCQHTARGAQMAYLAGPFSFRRSIVAEEGLLLRSLTANGGETEAFRKLRRVEARRPTYIASLAIAYRVC